MKHHILPADLPEKPLHTKTALAKCTTKIPIAYLGETIAEVQNVLTRHTKDYESIRYIYVVDDERKLAGVLSIKELFRAPHANHVETIMTKEPISVHPTVDQEHLAIKALSHKLGAMPVVTHDNTLIGAVTTHTLLSILHTEHTEDFLRLAGIHGFRDPEMTIINAPAATHVVKRLPWLIAGLAGGLCAAIIVSSFETILERELTLAAFIPAIVYLADAVGNQTQTLYIRSLAIDHTLNIRKYILRESIISVMIAAILSLLISIGSYIIWKEPQFMAIFGISIFLTVMLAVTTAITVPTLCRHFKLDPALASGPFATIFRDITSLLIYFTISILILRIV